MSNPTNPTNQDLLGMILNSKSKTIVEFISNPCCDYDTHNIIAQTDMKNTQTCDYYLRNFIDAMIQIGALAAGCVNDNKIGIRLEVLEMDYLVYLYKIDTKYVITADMVKKGNAHKIFYKFDLK